MSDPSLNREAEEELLTSEWPMSGRFSPADDGAGTPTSSFHSFAARLDNAATTNCHLAAGGGSPTRSGRRVQQHHSSTDNGRKPAHHQHLMQHNTHDPPRTTPALCSVSLGPPILANDDDHQHQARDPGNRKRRSLDPPELLAHACIELSGATKSCDETLELLKGSFEQRQRWDERSSGSKIDLAKSLLDHITHRERLNGLVQQMRRKVDGANQK